MRALIIEDTLTKMKCVEKCISEVRNGCKFIEAMSYSEGITKIYEGGWDIVLLDMSLPTYNISHTESGGTKKPLAGKEIIKRMLSRKIFIPTIIITQFETFGETQISLELMNDEFREKYTNIWKGTISYGKQGWQENLIKLLDEIDNGK